MSQAARNLLNLRWHLCKRSKLVRQFNGSITAFCGQPLVANQPWVEERGHRMYDPDLPGFDLKAPGSLGMAKLATQLGEAQPMHTVH